jgi:dihydrofolate reductase
VKNIVVAYDCERAIGIKGGLLWERNEMRADINHFKDITTGSVIIMGRKTFDSIGAVLPNRQSIVISRGDLRQVSNVIVVNSLEVAYKAAEGYEEAYIIGGGQIYKQAINDMDRIYATEVDAKIEGADTYFPEIDDRWKKITEDKYPADNNNIYPYNFVTYEKK